MRGIRGWLLALAAVLCLCGCSREEQRQGERREIDFTVVEQEKLPQELRQIIEKNKKDEIRMTYLDGEELYLIRGYGEQKTGGYNISVVECTEDEAGIYLDTRLTGPSNQDNLSRDPSYPCLVLKMEARDKEVEIR